MANSDSYEGPKTLYWCPKCQGYVRRNDVVKSRTGKRCHVCGTKLMESYNHGRYRYVDLKRGLYVQSS